MEPSSLNITHVLIFQEETYKAQKTNKNSALKKCLVFCDISVIFTAVNHLRKFSWKILCKENVNIM